MLALTTLSLAKSKRQCLHFYYLLPTLTIHHPPCTAYVSQSLFLSSVLLHARWFVFPGLPLPRDETKSHKQYSAIFLGFSFPATDPFPARSLSFSVEPLGGVLRTHTHTFQKVLKLAWRSGALATVAPLLKATWRQRQQQHPHTAHKLLATSKATEVDKMSRRCDQRELKLPNQKSLQCPACIAHQFYKPWVPKKCWVLIP